MSGNLDYAEHDSGPSVRDAVESAVAEVTPGHNSDTDFIIDGALEERTRRQRDAQDPQESRWDMLRKSADRLRDTIRKSTYAEMEKAAAAGPLDQPRKAGTTAEIEPGPPQSWDKRAKQAWDQLPVETRLAVKRQESAFEKAHAEISPHLTDLVEIDRQLAPLKPLLEHHGIHSRAEAVGKLLGWEAKFRNPETRTQAFYDLAKQYEFDLGAGQPQYGYDLQQQYAQQYDPVAAQQAEQAVASFGQGRPHFEQVRSVMGGLMYADATGKYLNPDGSCNLDRAYRDACRAEGLDHPAPRRASSPRGRAPAGDSYDASERKSGRSVGASIRDAFKEVRDRSYY